MGLMRNSDKHVQTVNFLAYLNNSVVIDGNVLNAREYLRSTPEYSNMYEGTSDQRKQREKNFEKDIEKLVNEKGVLKLGQVVDNKVNPRLVSRWQSFTGDYNRETALTPIDGTLYPNLAVLASA